MWISNCCRVLVAEYWSGAENGAERAKESDERSRVVSGSRKNELSTEWEVAERSELVSGLNLPLMAAKACCPLYSLYSALCSLQFNSVTVIKATLPCNCKTFTITMQKSSEIMLTFALME